MKLNEALSRLPDTNKKVVITHSGGLDSSTALILAVEKYGADNVISIGYNYGQKQSVELQRAAELCGVLGVKRNLIDLSILGDIVRSVSANIAGTEVAMPTIKDILGNPQPPTYVPFRNMVLFSLTASFAEANAASHIICGLQVHDEYSYWDTTQRFVDGINNIYSQNRSWPITLVAPFSDLSKTEELELLQELGKLDLLVHSLTCYNPNELGESCGKCPSCAERIKAFMDIGVKDPIPYSVDIPWRV
jgi:7-cyano-7-deazaguanine synthase